MGKRRRDTTEPDKAVKSYALAKEGIPTVSPIPHHQNAGTGGSTVLREVDNTLMTILTQMQALPRVAGISGCQAWEVLEMSCAQIDCRDWDVKKIP